MLPYIFLYIVIGRHVFVLRFCFSLLYIEETRCGHPTTRFFLIYKYTLCFCCLGLLRFRLFHHLMVHDKVAHKMRGRRHGPRHRVREEQYKQRAVHLEDRQDPHHTQRTRTCKRYNHRHDRIPHTAQNAHMRVHNAAKEVRYAHNEHTLQTVLDNLRVRRIYRK